MAPCEFIDDLVPLILEAHSNWWPRDLAKLSLVSPCWLHYTRKRLYPYPIVESWSAGRLLARTVSENAQLGRLITGIRLQPLKEEGKSCGASAEEWDGLRQLLTVEGLKRVHIGGALSIQAERIIPMIADGESVEELEVDGSLLWGQLYKTPSIVWSDNIAFQFPNLRRLVLRHVELEVEAGSVAGYASPITSLEVDEVSITGGHLVDMLCECESLEELKISTKDCILFDEELRLIVGCCRVSRISYELRHGRCLDESVLGGEWKDWDSLRWLELKGMFMDRSELEKLEDNCKKLEELVIGGRFVRISAVEWISFVDNMSNLSRISVPGGNNIPPFISWGKEEKKEIGDICRQKDINLVIL